MTSPARALLAFKLRPASAQDMESIRTLLEASELPVADLSDSRPEFVVAEATSIVVGVVGLQQFGKVALLRSLAVAIPSRGTGVGSELVGALERLALSRGIEELVLLTTTAERFFASRGYELADRARLPKDVLASAEFRSLCPATAACMSKRLDGGAKKL